MIIGGASAYPRIIDFERMAAIAHEVDAVLMIDMAHIQAWWLPDCIPARFPMRTW